MKKSKNFTLVLLITSLLISCTEKPQDHIPIINLEEVQHSINLSDIIELDSVISIKSNGFMEFGEVKRILQTEYGILLHTSSPSSLSLSNHSGELIEQYVPDHLLENITSVSVVGDKIYVLDRPSMQIHLFNFSLEHEGYISIPFFAQSFQILSADRIVLFIGNEVSTNDGKLITYNPATKQIIRDELDISTNHRRYFNFLTTYHFFESLDKKYFWESSSNCIYKVTADNEVENAFKLDYGNNGVDTDFYDNAKYNSPYEFVSDMRAKGISHRHFKVLGNNTHLLIQFDHGDQFATSIYSIKNGSTFTFNDIHDNFFANTSMEAIELNFFTSLGSNDTFIGFIPFEYFNEEVNDFVKDPSQNYLVFGRLK